MTGTAFSRKRMEFTKRAHLAAQRQFYAPMFTGLPLTFEDTVGTTRDLEYAIDCQVAVTVDGLRGPLRFAVQERWREPEFMGFGDVTVTEWNLATNQPSELHKLGAQLFVYGFYEQANDQIVLGVAVDVAVMLRELAIGQLNHARGSRGDQSFLGFKATSLAQRGAIVFGVDNRQRADDWPPVPEIPST